LALGVDRDLYLIDEPSAYLDVEMRVAAAKAIRRFIYNNQKSCFVVEHDLQMASYLADQVILFRGEPSVSAVASSPLTPVAGFDQFMRSLQITVRRDSATNRIRINRPGTRRDMEQKKNGTYMKLESGSSADKDVSKRAKKGRKLANKGAINGSRRAQITTTAQSKGLGQEESIDG